MGETRVDLLHLLEDLADAYPGELAETILTEIVANALDSGATTISLATDPTNAALTVADNGAGMRRADLRRFHDIAATTKERGQGIGFAGVGIKLGLLVSEEVVTETRRGKDHVATTWALATRKRAPWQWVPPPGLVGQRGTAVRLRLQNALSPLLDPGLIESALIRHFEPLFDPTFDEILHAHYEGGIRFVINGREIPRGAAAGPDRAPIAVHLPRGRKPVASGFIVRHPAPLAEEHRGVAISTYGKVIKRGWDWLGVTPAGPELVNGLIEAPGLAACLTLNKADFLRTGPRGAVYLSYRKALQEALSRQLEAWGDTHHRAEKARSRAARPVERDVETVLLDLADQFPMLAMLVERRSGGQRKLLMGTAGRAPDGGQPSLLPSTSGPESAAAPAAPAAPARESVVPEDREPAHERETQPESERTSLEPPAGSASPGAPSPSLQLPARKGRRRPARLGLTIQFESRPDDPDLGRLEQTTVWVNDAHPAYRRAAASRAESYHLALSVALALARVAVEPAQEHAFVSEFLSRWGDAAAGSRKTSVRRKRPPRHVQSST